MGNPKTRREIRKWLEGELGKAIPPDVWRELGDEGFVDGALTEGAALGLDELELAARTKLARIRGPAEKQPKRLKSPPLQSLIREEDYLRAQVFWRYLGRQASAHPDVVSTRKRLFDGRILTAEEGQGLLDSEALRFLPRRWFDDNNVPLVGHRSGWFEPDGRQTPDWTSDTGLRIEWPGGSKFIRDGSQLDARARNGGLLLKALGQNGFVLAGSVLDHIRKASTSLQDHYDWKEWDATRFILIGVAPNYSPITVEPTGGWRPDHSHFQFQITVEPWMSPRSVLRVFREYQNAFTGRQSRPMKEKSLKLFDYVSDRLQAEDPPPWREIMADWNKECRERPEWTYKDVRLFARDYKRTGRQLAFPHHPWIAIRRRSEEQV